MSAAAIRATTGTELSVWMSQLKNAHRSAEAGTALPANAQELKTARQNLQTLSGTRFPVSRRPTTTTMRFGNLQLHRVLTRPAARLSAAINVHQATTGTARHALILRQKNVLLSAAHGTAPAASAQELKTVRQNLPTQCGTRFPASHRPGTAQRGNLRRHRATTQAAARLSAVTNAQQTTSGTALRAWLPSPNAAQLHRPRARIHLPAISGLQRHQRPTHGRMQLITATAIQKAA